jgi:hypothetical protein
VFEGRPVAKAETYPDRQRPGWIGGVQLDRTVESGRAVGLLDGGCGRCCRMDGRRVRSQDCGHGQKAKPSPNYLHVPFPQSPAIN